MVKRSLKKTGCKQKKTDFKYRKMSFGASDQATINRLNAFCDEIKRYMISQDYRYNPTDLSLRIYDASELLVENEKVDESDKIRYLSEFVSLLFEIINGR